VVTKEQQRGDAGSGSDERWPDECDGKRTSRDEKGGKEEVAPASKRRVGGVREC